jgi:hypothetical protein
MSKMDQKIKNQKISVTASVIIAALFFLAQFIFVKTIFYGIGCAPYLDAPAELTHWAYQTFYYGFPISFVVVAQHYCVETPFTTYEWSAIGLAVDISLLILLTYPLWMRWLRKKSAIQA